MRKMKTVPVDDDLGEIINWAVRYSLGRRSYAVMDTCNYVKPLIPDLNNRTLWCIARDITEQAKFGYGDQCDEKQWIDLLDNVNQELSARTDNTLLDAIG